MKMSYLCTIFAVAIGATLPVHASSFTITSSTSGSTTKFIVSRSDTNSVETVNYRTVSLSAYANQHFNSQSGTLTFPAGQKAVTNSVTETSPSSAAYRFQTGANRSYRFELTDVGGFPITNAVRSITTGTQLSTTYLNREVTDLVYFTSGGSITSGSGNKYLDVTYGPSSYRQVTDGGYNQAVHTVGTGSLYGNNADLRTFLDGIGCKMYATVYFTQKEEQDGYQYIQILADNATTYDGNDPDGAVDTPSTSIYKACFILSYTPSGSVMEDDHYQFFPHRYDYADKAAETSAGISHYEFDYNNSHLYEQKFRNNTPSYRTSTSGSLVLPTSVNNLNIRFDAAGSGGDTWDFKNLKVRLALVDTASPVMLTASAAAAPGVHAKGNDLYVSVAFNEPVTCSSASLTTTWGTLSHNSGSGSNVLTFKGKISDTASGNLNITSWSGTIKDLAGNELAGSSALNQSNLATLTDSHSYSISYDLAGGSASNPISYTYESAEFTLANPTRTGYTFAGWSGTGIAGLTNAVTIAAHSHGDRAYAAHWTPITYTVHFDANGGTGTPMPDQSFTYDAPQALASNTFARAHYAFAGWSGAGATFADRETVCNLTNESATVMLTATWTPAPTWTGDGTAESPYLIYNRNQLDDLAAYVNANDGSYRDSVYRLMADIAYDPAATNSFTPIGRTSSRFQGVFDGNGHTIGGISISRPDTNYQGLFGYLDIATVMNLTLADSSIEGYSYVGGLFGYAKNAAIRNCFVTGTSVAGNSDSGAVGGNAADCNLIKNAYHGCTRNGSADNRGIGNLGDTLDRVWPCGTLSFESGVEPFGGPDYAFPVYGTTNSYYAVWRRVDVRTAVAGATVFVDGSTNGVDGANGEFYFNMPDGDATVFSAVAYLDANGDTQFCAEYAVITNAAEDRAEYGGSGRTSWYVVGGDVTIDGTLRFLDTYTHLILCDGATLAVTNASGSGYAIDAEDLLIYCQAGGTGAIAANGGSRGISAYSVTVNGGSVTADSETGHGIYATSFVTINGGTVNATGSYGIYARSSLTINGGNITAYGSLYDIFSFGTVTIGGGTVVATGNRGINANRDIVLGWTDYADSITANSYSATVSVKAGQLLTDGTAIYQGAVDPAEIAGKALRPYLVPYIDANGDGQVCTNYTVIASSDGDVRYGGGWYVVSTNATISGNLYFSDYNAHLILCDGATLAVTNANGIAIGASGSLTIYGQPNGTGALVATSAAAAGIYAYLGSVTINGGNVTVTGDDYGIYVDPGNVTINGGNITVTGCYYGINATGVTINGGTVTANDSETGIFANYDLTINGGNVNAVGGYYGDGIWAGNITLGWTNPTDSIYANSYNGYVSVKDGQLLIDGNNTYSGEVNASAIAGKALRPPMPAISYLDADGTEQQRYAYIVLTNAASDVRYDDGLENWYVVTNDVTISGELFFRDDFAHLILCDGATLTVTNENGIAIDANNNLTIYCQTNATGALVANGSNNGIYADQSVTINGGRVTATGGVNGEGIYANASVTINGGRVSATGGVNGIYAYSGSVTINGGNVTATGVNGEGIYADDNRTVTLGWTSPTDSIYASSYYYNVRVKAGQLLTDGTTVYQGEVDPGEIAGKTLRPYLVPYIDANGDGQVCTNYTVLTDAAGDVEYGESGAANWYVVSTNVTISGNLFFSDYNAHLILCDGATLAVTNASSIAIGASDSLTIYGQTNGTGAVVANGDYGIAIGGSGSVTINGGNVTAIGRILGIAAGNSITINGGNVTATGVTYGIYVSNGTITINGGNVTATGDNRGIYVSNGSVTINGGNVNATGGTYGICANDITLGWTNPTDSIYASRYYCSRNYVVINGVLIDGYTAYSGRLHYPDAIAGKTLTPPMPAISYIDEDGYERQRYAYTVLTNAASDVEYGAAESWYVVTNAVTISGKLEFNYYAHLILCDGATLAVTNSTPNDKAIHANGGLAIYGQADGTGTLAANGSDYGICAYLDLTINGGSITATGNFAGITARDITINGGTVTANGSVCVYGICANGNLTINGGTVTATVGDYGIYADDDLTINGGSVAATGSRYGICADNGDITLGWTDPADSITVSSYSSDNGTVSVKTGQSLTDGTTVYQGEVDSDIDGKTLRPCLSWKQLQALLDAGGTVTLPYDVAATNGDATLTVTNAVTLDLNGHVIDAVGRFRVIEVLEGGDLTLTNSVEGAGAVTGGRDRYYGGGVYVNGGVFTMTGGKVSDNVVGMEEDPDIGTRGGGGVYVNSGAFAMTGGEISGNVVYLRGNDVGVYGGGGVYVNEYGTFAMSGGSILSNSVQSYGIAYGGGVCLKDNSGTGTMTGGTIVGNFVDTTGDGGSIYAAGGGMYVNKCAFTMSGGEISGNWSSKNGGGVALGGINCAFVMSGGEISGNTAKCLGIQNVFGGGGVYMNNSATFAMTNSVVSGNVASKGGGVYVNNGTFRVSGSSVVSGNTNLVGETRNVYLAASRTITVEGLAAGASIGVQTETKPTTNSYVKFATGASAGEEEYFFSDIYGYDVQLDGSYLWLGQPMAFPTYLRYADNSVRSNYVVWATCYGEDSNSEHEDAFLLNVAPAATPVGLRIDGIDVVDGGATVRVAATAGGEAVDMERVNGVISLAAGDELGSLALTAVPSENVTYENGEATIFVPASDGTFIRARVGVATPGRP